MEERTQLLSGLEVPTLRSGVIVEVAQMGFCSHWEMEVDQMSLLGKEVGNPVNQVPRINLVLR